MTRINTNKYRGNTDLSWEVEEQQLVAMPSGTVSESSKAIVRNDTNDIVGIVGSGYTPILNETIRATASAIAQRFGVDPAYRELQGGALIRAQCRVNTLDIAGDSSPYDCNVVISSSHNGSQKHVFLFEVVRQVCTNGMAISIAGLTSRVSISHTKNKAKGALQMDAAIEMAAEYFSRLQSIMSGMATKTMSGAEMDRMLEQLWPNTIKPKVDGKTILADMITSARDNYSAMEQLLPSASAVNRRALVKGLFQGAGVELGNGTLLDALNAVTEYADHHGSSPDAREVSSIYGQRAAQKQKAFNYLQRLL